MFIDSVLLFTAVRNAYNTAELNDSNSVSNQDIRQSFIRYFERVEDDVEELLETSFEPVLEEVVKMQQEALKTELEEVWEQRDIVQIVLITCFQSLISLEGI